MKNLKPKKYYGDLLPSCENTIREDGVMVMTKKCFGYFWYSCVSSYAKTIMRIWSFQKDSKAHTEYDALSRDTLHDLHKSLISNRCCLDRLYNEEQIMVVNSYTDMLEAIGGYNE